VFINLFLICFSLKTCIVISPDEMNNHLRTVVIAPMTTSSKNYPTGVEMKHDYKIGWIVLDQIRTIDKQRILNDLAKLSKPEIKDAKAILSVKQKTVRLLAKNSLALAEKERAERKKMI
jgi:mRNA interferase MazF